MTIPTLGLDFMPGAGPFDVAGDYYLLTTGASGSNATTPDAAALDVTGDLVMEVDADLDTWAASPGGGLELFGKFVPPSNQSYLLWINSQRKPVLRWSTDGTAIIDAVATAAIPITSGRLALRAKLDVNNGAGGWTVQWQTAPTYAGTFTALGTDVTGAGTTSIFNSTATVGVGDVPSSGFARASGRFYTARIHADLAMTDTRANPNFYAQAPGTTSFADAAGRTWTVNSPAKIAGFDWVSLSTRLLSGTWSWGRTDELSQFPPGEAEFTLQSDDRQLDPTYASGTWFGKLNPRVPFRLRMSTDGGSTWKDQWYGFVEGGFEQGYDGPKSSTCTVRLVDLLEVIGSTRLPANAYAAEVLADTPGAYWTLDETTGTQMADSSGNGRHGSYDNGLLGQEPLITGNGHSVNFPHVGDNRGRWSGQGLPVTSPCTLEAWCKTPRDLSMVKSVVVVQRDASIGSRLWLGVTTSGAGSPNGEIVIDFAGLGTFYKARGSTRVDDDVRHHVVATIAGLTAADVKLYVDGVLQTKTTISGTNPGSWTPLLAWTVGNYVDIGSGDFGFDGLVDEVAIYPDFLDASRVTAHYIAGTTAFDTESTDARVNRVLDLIGVPTGLRDIAAGDTTCGPATYNQALAGDYLRGVTESEQGQLFIDHANGGKITFRGRYYRVTNTRSTTSQATFTDTQPTPGGQYAFKDLHPSPNGIASIVNEAVVSWPGGQEIVQDVASKAAYGPRSRNLTTEARSPAAAASAGQWMIARYGQPQSRIRSLDISPGTDTGVWAPVLDRRVGDRVTVNWTPAGVGSQISQQLIVEGGSGEIRGGVEWDATWHFSDADDSQVWIWGTSTWGETTTWG